MSKIGQPPRLVIDQIAEIEKVPSSDTTSASALLSSQPIWTNSARTSRTFQNVPLRLAPTLKPLPPNAGRGCERPQVSGFSPLRLLRSKGLARTVHELGGAGSIPSRQVYRVAVHGELATSARSIARGSLPGSSARAAMSNSMHWATNDLRRGTRPH